MSCNFKIILLGAFLVSACSSRPPNPVIIDKSGHIKKVKMIPASFTDGVALGAFRTECSMLKILNESILDFSAKDKITTGTNTEDYSLEVSFTEVIPHKWTFGSFRPSSNATITATINNNGEVIETTTKTIGSGAALGACDRLDKIALASGKYVAKWLATK